MWRRRPPDSLTPREQEVLDLLRLGLTNEEIAERLKITVAGAKYHVSQILSKLGVATREEAAAVAGERRRWWAAWPVWAHIAGAATVAAAAAGLAVLSWGVVRTNGTQQSTDNGRGTVLVAVAAQSLPARMPISDDKVKFVRVPAGEANPNAYSDTSVVGHMTRVAFAEGELFTPSKIIRNASVFEDPYSQKKPSHSSNVSPLEACRVPPLGRYRSGPPSGPREPLDPIAVTLEGIRNSNTCNQPDASTAKATPSTWDTAHAIVQARGGFIEKLCGSHCVPDDSTRVWIVEVHGTFVPPEEPIGGNAMVPDSNQREQPPTSPPTGTWFAIIPVWN